MDRVKKIINIIILVSLGIGVILALIEMFWFHSIIIKVFAAIMLLTGFGLLLWYNIILPFFED